MALVYADPADLAGWTGQPAPDDAVPLLRVASSLVRKATRTAVYATDTSGKPSDADVRLAFTEATCEHAAAMDAAGVDPFAAGTDAQIASTSIGSASVSYAGADGAAAARLRLSTELCPGALAILADAGLTATPPAVLR